MSFRDTPRARLATALPVWLWLAVAAAGCSFHREVPSGKVKCDPGGVCPGGLMCVASPDGTPGLMVCCQEPTCGRGSGRRGGAGGGSGGTGGGGGAGAGTGGGGAGGAAGSRADASGAGGGDAPAGDRGAPAEASSDRPADGGGPPTDRPPADGPGPGQSDATGGGADRPPVPPPDMRVPDAPVQQPPSAALARGLVLYLRLDDAPGSFNVRDSSGAANVVALRDLDPAVAWVDGRIGRAVALTAGSGGGGWLRAESSVAINGIGDGFTVSAWVRRPGGGAGNGGLVTRRAGGPGGFHYAVDIINSRLRARVNSANGYRADVSSMEPIPDSQWAHLAASYDMKVVRLYINGRLLGSQPYEHAIGPDNTPLVIGAAQEVTVPEVIGSRLDAVVDEVAVYQRALDAGEIGMLASGVQPAASP
jgi:hypothetical protein